MRHLLQRLFSRRPPAESEPVRVAPATPEREGRETPGRAPTEPTALVARAGGVPVTSTAVPDEQVLALQLSDDLRARVSRLQHSLRGVDHSGDADEFLESLTARFDAVVRHPPLAAQRALSVTRDPRSPISRIVQLVEQDPGLGQALLRYANSAYYAARGGQVVSLHAAVHRVGTSGVHNVVLRTMVDGMLCRPGSAFQAQVNRVWEHMVQTAPLARAIASVFGVASDEAYALGLLHDVGKLIVFDRLGELRVARRREVDIAPAVVSAILRLLHEPLGGVAALQWGLGALAAQGIATHHRSPVPPEVIARSELLFVAQQLAGGPSLRDRHLLEAWWLEGRLTADQAGVSKLLDALELEGGEAGSGEQASPGR